VHDVLLEACTPGKQIWVFPNCNLISLTFLLGYSYKFIMLVYKKKIVMFF